MLKKIFFDKKNQNFDKKTLNFCEKFGSQIKC